MNKTVAFAAALYLALLPSYAQSLSFYMDMGDKPAFEGISCVTEETLVNGNKVWDITLTNNSTGIFEPVKAGVRLGLDTYMDKYPDWLYKYFPTFLNCCPTHFYGYMQSPSGKMLGIVSPDPIASWSVDYNLAYEEPAGYWFYGHRISSVNLDLINALPLPDHNPQHLWKLDPGQTMKWQVVFMEINEPALFEKTVHDVSEVPVIKMDKTSYTSGQSASFELFAENPSVTITDSDGHEVRFRKRKSYDRWNISCILGKPGIYKVKVRDGRFVTEGRLAVNHSWEWTMRKAREGVLKHKQRATSHVESWYGYHSAFLAARYFPDSEEDLLLKKRFDDQMAMLYGNDRNAPLYYEWRIQNTSSTIGMYVDKYEAFGDIEDLKTAGRLADWLIGYAQWRDDAYRNKWNTVYTSVIYVAKSILELYEAEKRYSDYLISNGHDGSFWLEAARRHYDSAKRAIDQLVASKGEFHTEGEITFEDGMISCSALQMGRLALLQNDPKLRQHYTEAMLAQLENHDCLTQLRVPDARRRGGTMRYWEAQYDVHMMPNMFNSPHGWSAWRAYATYYAYLLTGQEKWLLETWNAMGAFAGLIDHETGELRWAFVIDPYIRAKQMHVPVKGIDPDSLDFGNPHPDMYRTREFVFGEQYVSMVSSWQTRNSQDNDVHEVFKCLGETFLTNAFIVERADGSIVGYNCDVVKRGGVLKVSSPEKQIVNLHVNLINDYQILYNGRNIQTKCGTCDFVSLQETEVMAPSPQTVIFDTDMGNDIDDALALQMLLNYHKKGVIDLKGITISKAFPDAVAYVDGFCRYNGLNDMPIGYVYEGPNKDAGNYIMPTLKSGCISPVRTINSDIPKAHELLKSLLEKSEDGSVTIIAVGPLTNLARLLQSEDGLALVARKVSHLYLMSGDFLGKGSAEWNVLQDIEASAAVYEKCPVPVTTSGFEVGKVIKYPATSILNDFGDPTANPLCISYSHFLKMPYDRPVWDLLAVLEAVEPSCRLFGSSPKGWITVDGKGVTTFKEDPHGLHDYMIENPDNRSKVVEVLIDRVKMR